MRRAKCRRVWDGILSTIVEGLGEFLAHSIHPWSIAGSAAITVRTFVLSHGETRYYKLPANNQEWSTMNRQNQDSTHDEAIEKNPTVERREHMAPRTPVEELIAGIYASSLNVSPLGVYDDLPTLSITPQVAAQLNLRLRQIFDVHVPVDQLLMYDTIDALVNFLSELWGGREIIEEIAWTFLQIEQLSDNEVRSQLANELSTGETDVTRK
jgi:hypothetical protein